MAGRRGKPDEGLYISIVGWRRYSRGTIARPEWIKMHVADLLEDETLAALSVPTRYLYQGLLALASRHDGLVPLDARRIAGRLAMRGRDVTLGLSSLATASKVEVVSKSEYTSVVISEGGLQLALATQEESGQTADHPRGHPTGDPGPPRARPRETRQREREVPSNTTSTTDSARDLALPEDQEQEELPETLRRLIAHGANGEAKSASQILRHAAGLPEAAIARTLESLLYRRPKPRNPGGYVVNTLRKIRAEEGYPPIDDPTIEREPDL